MKAKVIGFLVGKAKTGSIGTTVYFEIEHDDYRRENALRCEGNATSQEYIRGDYSEILEVGALVDLVYGKGYQDKAVLREIVPVEA